MQDSLKNSVVIGIMGMCISGLSAYMKIIKIIPADVNKGAAH